MIRHLARFLASGDVTDCAAVLPFLLLFAVLIAR